MTGSDAGDEVEPDAEGPDDEGPDDEGPDDESEPSSDARSGPARWIWVTAALVVIAGFGIAIALAGSTDDTSSGSSSTTVGTVPADLRTALGRQILPGIDGFRVVAPASGSELLSRADIEGRPGAQAPAVPVPGGGAQAGWRRDFTSTTNDDVVRIVLLHMETAADATRARTDLQQWWVRQQGTVLDDAVPVGSTEVMVGASTGADANGDHAQIAIGAVGRTVVVVLRFSKGAATDTAALLKVAADQSLRLQAG